MKQSTERKTILAGFAVAVAILTTIGLLAYHQIHDLIETSRWVAQTHEETEKLEAILARLAEAELGRRGFIISGQPRYLDVYHDAAEAVTKDLDSLDKLVGTNVAQRRRLKTLLPWIADRLMLLEQSVALRRAGNVEAATKRFLDEKDDALTEQIRATIGMMVTVERTLLDERNANAAASSRRTFLVLVIGSLIAYLLLAMMFYRLEREVVVRLKSEAALRRAQDELEQRVAARTVELAEANRVLRESQAVFQSLASVSPVGIFRADADGRCIYVNARLCQITGLPAERLLGDGWRDAVHPDARERVTTSWPQATYSFQRFEMEFRLQRADQSVVWVLCQSVAERDEHGVLLGHIGTVTDITGRVEQEGSLRQLSGRLLQLQDEERRRIARELHDVTGQNLSAAALDLGRLLKPGTSLDAKGQQLLAEALMLTEQSLQEIRTLSYLLHPPFLDEAGLVDALSWYVEGFSKRSGIRVDLVALPDVGRLPREAETTLFRVVQESLSNIHRHSGSKTAAIQLARDNGRVCLEVRDTGGLTMTAASEAERRQAALGVGITGMRERMRQLGGSLEIDFGRHGTTVKAVLPIEKSEP